MSPFDYLTAINQTKKNIIIDSDNPELAEKLYNPYLTNKGLSYFIDTVHLANEMNKHYELSHNMQFTFLLNTVRKRKRFSKWHKPEKDEVLDMIVEYYDYSYDKARQVAHLFSDEQIKIIKKSLGKGGTTHESYNGDDGGG